MHEAWVALTKYKSTSFFCTQPPLFHTFLPRFTKPFTFFYRSSIFEPKVSKEALKPWQKLVS